jgi:hypothetical protein
LAKNAENARENTEKMIMGAAVYHPRINHDAVPTLFHWKLIEGVCATWRGVSGGWRRP